MNEEKTDDSLNPFLFTFKTHIDQLNEVVHDFYQQITNRSKAVEKLFCLTNEEMRKAIENQQKQLLDDISTMKNQRNLTDDKSLDNLLHFLDISYTEK